MTKFFISFLVCALLSVVLTGCGGKVEDTYTLATLREATRGDLLSPGFKFSFDTPQFIAAHKDVAIVREGNLMEFFVGDGLEGEVQNVMGRKFIIGARKLFNPLIHFTVDFMVVGNDTVRVGEPYEATLPGLLRARDYSTEEFEEVELDELTSNRLKLREIQDTRFKVSEAKVTYEEVVVDGEPTMMYILHLKNVRFIIEDPNDAVQLVLKALINENLYFEGGVSYGSIASRGFREGTSSAGYITIEYINYGGMVVGTR